MFPSHTSSIIIALVVLVAACVAAESAEYTETDIGTWSHSGSMTFSVTEYSDGSKGARIFVRDRYIFDTLLFSVDKESLTDLKDLINRTIAELDVQESTKTTRTTTHHLGEWSRLGNWMSFSVTNNPSWGAYARIYVSDRYMIETVSFWGLGRESLVRLRTLVNATIAALSDQSAEQPGEPQALAPGEWQDNEGNSIRFSVEVDPVHGVQAVIDVSDKYVVETVQLTDLSVADLMEIRALINDTIDDMAVSAATQGSPE